MKCVAVRFVGHHPEDKLKEAVKDLESGIEASDAYTVADAVRDWLAKGTKKLGAGTVEGYRILADQHLIPEIGKAKLPSKVVIEASTFTLDDKGVAQKVNLHYSATDHVATRSGK